MPLTASSIASMEGLKKFATCALYIIKQTIEFVGLGANGSFLPLQRKLPAFDVTAIVVVPRGTKFHEFMSAVLREVGLQSFVKALSKCVKV